MRKTSFEAARQVVVTDAGRNAMNAIRDLIGQMQQHERARLADDVAANDKSFRSASREILIAAILGVAAACGFLWLLRRYLTALGKATSEIHEQREVLHATLASIGDGVVTTDHGCQVNFLNKVAESLTGWTLANAHGKQLDEIFPIINEKSRLPVENPCKRVFREGIVVGLANHTLLIAKDGRETPIDDSAAPIRDLDGKTIGAVLVFRDATAERRAADNRERLAAIVESSSDAIIGEDADGVITTWNQAAEHLLGYSAAEAIGQSIYMLVPHELRGQVDQALEKLHRGEKAQYLETVRLCKDGRRIEVSSHVSPIRNKEGELIGAAKVLHDISDRRRTERVLQFLANSTAEMATLVDYQSTMQRIARLAVPFFADWCVVDMIDPQGRIQRVAYAHADVALEPLLKELVDSFPPDWNSAALSAQVLRTGQPQLLTEMASGWLDKVAVDSRHRKLLDQLGPLSAVSAPIIIRNVAVGSLNFVTAASGRRYAAADLELAIELARRSAVAIENAQLYRELQEAQRQKDDFLAMLAHELRNPISAIQYANELSKITGSDDHQPKEVIDRQVRNLNRLIEDLLDVLRITRDKIELRREPIDASVILQRAVATAEPQIRARKHALIVDPVTEPLPLFVDSTRAEQILVNLLTNAAKYTPEGGNISVRAAAAAGFVEFQVKDTGLGIPEPMLNRVFELFTQLEPSLDRSQGGLGIGLTVVRKLVELHGGNVSATSDGPGCGSVFIVRLPLVEGSAATAHATDVGAVARTQSQKILVVDDNTDAAQSLSILLRDSGHTVETVHDGIAAVTAAQQFKPDVIFLDLGLPGLDGFKVAEKLRRDESFNATRIIALSGYGQPQDRKRSQEAGFDLHLVKPVDFNEITAVLAGQPAG